MSQNSYFESDELYGKSIDIKIIKFLWKYARKYKTTFFASIFLSFMASVLVILIPYITSLVIDKGIEKSAEGAVVAYGLMLFAIQIVHFFVLGAQLYLMNYTGAKVIHELRVDLFTHVQNLKVAYFDKNPVGRVVTRLTNDMAAISELFSGGAVMMLFNLVFILGTMTFILFLNWKLGLITLASFPPLCFIGYKISILLRQSKRVTREKLAVINAFLSEHISGMRIVNLFSQEERTQEKFEQANAEYRQVSIEQMMVYALLMPAVTFLTGISVAFILWIGGIQVLDNLMTIGVFVAFISYVEWIMHPLRDIVDRYNVFLQSSTAAERLYKISLLPEEALPEETHEFSQVSGNVSFCKVHFKYGDALDSSSPAVLKDISFKINAGERVAIVGETGSGKTTILNLLNKFYTPNSGDIFVDGVNIKTAKRENLRRFLGKIDQNVHIFSGTIKDNVTLGAVCSKERIEEALRISNCEKIVGKYKEGLEYKITEAGKNLSFGERQLISFARLVLYNPSILIMDEATSNIDSENEKYITEAIDKITSGKTSIIVAHRLSTIINADKIFVIQAGELIEEGNHEELINRNGKYASLYKALIHN